MKKLFFTVFGCCILAVSCNNKPTLQQYFVKNQNQPNFVSMDVSPDVLKLDQSQLSPQEIKTLASFNKMNLLAFKVNAKNAKQYPIEKNEVQTILSDTTKYHQLMKFGSGAAGLSINFIGDENHINELVLFGNKKESGFAVVRILGNNMKPESALTLLSILQKSNIDAKQFKVLTDLVN